MQEIRAILARELAALWHKPFIGVAVAIAVGISAGLAVKGTPGIALGILAGGAVLGLWLYIHHIPRTPNDRVGLVVAISSDQEEESKRIEADFISSLRESLRRNPGNRFSLTIARPHVAIAVNAEPQLAFPYLRKARALFMLFGRARRRVVNGKETHVLTLECAVRHVELPDQIKTELADDLAQALPRRIMLPEDGSVLGFEVASQAVAISAEYAVATAGYLSGFLSYAETLFLHVETELTRMNVKVPGVRQMQRVLPDRLKDLYLRWLVSETDAYFDTRKVQHIANFDQIADKLLARDEADHPGLLAKAMANFLLRKDVAGAKKVLAQCKDVADGIWGYSLAFLNAYEGDLDAAYDEYRKAFKKPLLLNTRAATECEEFIQLVLDQDPAKTQLHFCLGLINYNAKKDYAAAKRDFQNFLNSDTAQAHPNARGKAEYLLQRIEEQLGSAT